MKKLNIMAMVIACSTVITPAFAGLQTDRAVINNPALNISAKANFSTPVSGDLYLATQIGEQLFFFTNSGQLTAEVTPFSQGQEYSGEVPLFNRPSSGTPPGRYTLFQVVTTPDSNLLDFRNWIGGLAGLSKINFTIGLPPQQSGDFNDDGFPDDDTNRDGFHDDDHDQNGFHDDDTNRDGFHDDDHDQNGFHDDDANEDGFYDDDNDQNGYRDDDENVSTTPEPVATPAPVATNSLVTEGQAAYASCASSSCHGTNPAFNQNGILKGRNAGETMSAIVENKGGMGFLSSVITADSANKISAYLNSI